jgi:hypothetical protein
MLLVPVTAEIRTHYQPNPKLIRYTLRPEFKFRTKTKDGEKVAIGRYVDELGRTAPLVIDKDFVFDLTKETDRRNYNTLRLNLQVDPELRQVIKIYDPQANALSKISSDRLINQVKSKLFEMENDEQGLAKLYRRLIGSAKGTPRAVVLDKLLRHAESYALDIMDAMNDQYADIRAIVDICIENEAISIGVNGMVRDKSNSIIASDIDELIHKMRTDTDVYRMIEIMATSKSYNKPTRQELAEAADTPEMRQLAESLIDSGDLELMDEEVAFDKPAIDMSVGDVTPDFIKRLIPRAIDLGIVQRLAEKGPKSGTVKIPSLNGGVGEYQLKTLSDYLTNNPYMAMQIHEMCEAIGGEEESSEQYELTEE